MYACMYRQACAVEERSEQKYTRPAATTTALPLLMPMMPMMPLCPHALRPSLVRRQLACCFGPSASALVEPSLYPPAASTLACQTVASPLVASHATLITYRAQVQRRPHASTSLSQPSAAPAHNAPHLPQSLIHFLLLLAQSALLPKCPASAASHASQPALRGGESRRCSCFAV